MTKRKKTAQAPKSTTSTKQLVAAIAQRHGLTEEEATRMMLKYLTRAQAHKFCDGWWLKLLDAQFQTHIGRFSRIRCGEEKQLSHLTPGPGRLCHDCGCSRGERHVFGCDAEECSNCGGQAFCCDC